MFTVRICLVILAVTAATNCRRIARSPGTMEIDVPNYSTESPNPDGLNEEGEYWQGEGDRANDKYEEDQENRNKTAQQNHEDLDNEKDYREEKQENNNKELQEDYDKNRDKMDDRQQEQEDHYNNEHKNDHEENNQQANEDFNKEVEEKGDRYGEKGQEGMDDREDKMNNYEAEGPSMTYTRD